MLGAALLSGCAPQGPAQLRVHEVLMYGQAPSHLTWVYGKLGSAKSSINIAGQSLVVRSGVAQDKLYAPGSLRLGSAAVYAGRPTALGTPTATVVRQPNDQFQVTATHDLSATYLVEGGQWYSLTGALSTGSTAQVTAAPLDPQSSVGSLTGAEASSIARLLASQGSLVVSVLPTLPEPAYKVQPTPSEHLTTALYVQPLAIASTVVTQPSGAVIMTTPVNTRPATFRMVATGSSAAVDNVSVQLASNQNALESLWRSAYGRQNPLPPTPLLGSQTAVGIFLGARPTGGYGLKIDGVEPQGDLLSVRVTLTAPAPHAITTQAITSPWAILSVSGQYSQVRVTDQNGNELK